MMPLGVVPSEEDLDVALEQAVSGMGSTDSGWSPEIDAILDRVAAAGRLTPQDEEEAYRLRQIMEDEENLREAEEGADPE